MKTKSLKIPRTGWRRSPITEQTVLELTGDRVVAYYCEPEPGISFVVSKGPAGVVASVSLGSRRGQLPPEAALDLWKWAERGLVS